MAREIEDTHPAALIFLSVLVPLQFNFLSPLIHFTEQFTVRGPGHPITASVGGEAVLPCHLSPRMSAENMELRWFRFKFSAVVHQYKDGQDQYGQQMPGYQGRTELLKDDITSGSVSLRIRNVQLSDHGQYTCFFQSSVSYEDALLELQVAVSGSDPHISVDGYQDGGIRVVCRSAGWYPEPEAQWRDRHGQLLPSASEKISKEANGLFHTRISIVITEHSNQDLSCFVRNPFLNQGKISTVSIVPRGAHTENAKVRVGCKKESRFFQRASHITRSIQVWILPKIPRCQPIL
uniref:Ig-like domain-containing protein n=1 Tax=Terrapene triunguis TaxID=2587831 RepID=A0A674IGK5_9SAUR